MVNERVKMKKFFLNIYYDFKLGIGLGGFNYEIDDYLDAILKDKIKIGIESIISKDQYNQSVKFEDGTVYEFWNSNKYYAWLNSGTFTFADGTEYRYVSVRPTIETMYKFKCALKNFVPIDIQNNPFNI